MRKTYKYDDQNRVIEETYNDSLGTNIIKYIYHGSSSNSGIFEKSEYSNNTLLHKIRYNLNNKIVYEYNYSVPEAIEIYTEYNEYNIEILETTYVNKKLKNRIVTLYDKEHNKILHGEISDNFWERWEYRSDGMPIYYANNTGEELEYEYLTGSPLLKSMKTIEKEEEIKEEGENENV